MHVPLDKLQLAPTDVASFIRFDQCQRYLRIRLHQREYGEEFLRSSGAVIQMLPPVLRGEGYSFERQIVEQIARSTPVVDFAADAFGGRRRDPDNDRVLDMLRELPCGDTIVLSQARLAAPLCGWSLRGDVDLLMLQKGEDERVSAFIADIKSSRVDRLEHHLQVAFYTLMLGVILDDAGIAHDPIETGVLFRGPSHFDNELSDDEIAEMDAQRDAASRIFGVETGLLEIVEDRETYFDIVEDLVTSKNSLARRVASTPFEDVEFHLDRKCDGCVYNEFCMRWSAERGDLSLIPHLTDHDKTALRRNGLRGVSEVAQLPLASESATADQEALDTRRALAMTWPLSPRLDELIYRARRYQASKGEPYETPGYIPGKGYTSLPFVSARQNPNLVMLYIDIGHDYLHDRLYMLGGRIVAHANGGPARERNIVHFAERPPDTGDLERDLVQRWINDVIAAIVGLAAADEDGEPNAPIHLVFWDQRSQGQLLNGLARHFETVLGSTPLYDFLTQRAAFDSGIVTYLEQEIREFRNYPLLCQSLQSVAIYLKFNWNEMHAFRTTFRTGMFDYLGKLEVEPDSPDPGWFYRRARYSSEIPLEYAYSAWGSLDDYVNEQDNRPTTYGHAPPELIRAFCARRLEALQHIASGFTGNQWTELTAFSLPELGTFEDTAHTLVEALQEFILVERHVEHAAWKAARLPAPEQRATNGDSLVVRYRDELQTPDTRIQNSENRRRQGLHDRLSSKLEDGEKLTPEQKKQTKWDHHGLIVRLELVTEGMDTDLDTLLGTSGLRDDSWVVIHPRTDVDRRLPEAERQEFTPTAKQLLWAARGTIKRLIPERDEAGVATSVIAEVEMRNWFPSHAGFLYSDFLKRPFENDRVYTIEPDPNDLTSSRGIKTIEKLAEGGTPPLYDRLTGAGPARADWPDTATAGQQRFLDGIRALREAGFHEFEASKQEYIGRHGTSPTLLVQGPPGTGKSYATAFAILARIQGALDAGIDYRVLISCKTHAAIDVVVNQILDVREKLSIFKLRHPGLFEQYFDERILTVPLCRIAPRGNLPSGVVPLTGRDKETGEDHVYKEIEQRTRCIVAGTPNAIYKMITDRFDSKRLFGHELIDCLIVDEASQIGLPESLMAALPLKPGGQLIVVGDPRQMPPIIKHDWEREFRRTAKTFNIHESLFAALAGLEPRPPLIQFEQSFRLHTDMAAFLRDSIYLADGIDYFSENVEVITPQRYGEDFVEAVLKPEHPLVVIVHDEEDSQKVNIFERELIAPILQALAHPTQHALDPADGFGIVVPHRAQRAALQDVARNLATTDTSGDLDRFVAAVDTVERFQGGERDVIIVSATESDRQYLLTAGEFLYDPRRLTVAVSRARQKMILIAGRTVFNTFVTDEELFAQTLLWKRLLRRTCTDLLWQGERHGHGVQVYGNVRH